MIMFVIQVRKRIGIIFQSLLENPLREKCPKTDFFSVSYFPVFGLNRGKYGPEKLFLRGDPFDAMPVSLLQWRAEIGIFSTKFVKYLYKSKNWHNVCPWYLNTFYTICCMFLLLLVCAGDIELNPGPIKNNASCNFSLCQWNLNSIAANNFLKRSLLKAYNM